MIGVIDVAATSSREISETVPSLQVRFVISVNDFWGSDKAMQGALPRTLVPLLFFLDYSLDCLT